MRGIDLWVRERAAARVFPNGLRVYAKSFDPATSRWLGTCIWMPKATNPCYHVHSCTDKQVRAAVERYYRGVDARNERKAKTKADQANGDLALMDPWTILSYGWGYDQTNREFWQVRRRSESTVYIARIGCERVGEPTSWCSENVAPVKDAFIETCDIKRHGIERCGYGDHFRMHSDTRDEQYHPFIGGIAEVRKRVGFMDGQPFLSMDHGIATPVPMLTFANADPLAVTSYHHSWGH
jgi:hypothetical protein